MDKRKMRITILGFIGILAVGVWLLGLVTQVGAETLSFKFFSHVVRNEVFPVGDVEGHTVGINVREGAVILTSGELAWMRAINSQDVVKGATSTDQYYTVTFQDGSTITAHTRVKSEATSPGTGKGGAGKAAGEIINGTGRFKGIKGTYAARIKFIPREKDELGPKALGEATFDYTLPSK